MRKLIKTADPDVVEEVKWVKATSPGTPTWSHDGIICTGETYKAVVKLTFAKGASLPGPGQALQLEPRREREARDRHPRGGEGRRGRVQGAHPRRGRPQYLHRKGKAPESEVMRPRNGPRRHQSSSAAFSSMSPRWCSTSWTTWRAIHSTDLSSTWGRRTDTVARAVHSTIQRRCDKRDRMPCRGPGARRQACHRRRDRDRHVARGTSA